MPSIHLWVAGGREGGGGAVVTLQCLDLQVCEIEVPALLDTSLAQHKWEGNLEEPCLIFKDS